MYFQDAPLFSRRSLFAVAMAAAATSTTLVSTVHADATPLSCQNGMVPVPKDNAPPVNAAPYNSANSQLPQGTQANKCSQGHAECYATCGKNKGDCDYQLYSCIYSVLPQNTQDASSVVGSYADHLGYLLSDTMFYETVNDHCQCGNNTNGGAGGGTQSGSASPTESATQTGSASQTESATQTGSTSQTESATPTSTNSAPSATETNGDNGSVSAILLMWGKGELFAVDTYRRPAPPFDTNNNDTNNPTLPTYAPLLCAMTRLALPLVRPKWRGLRSPCP
ncbi:MAG: hypothetical protein DHS80DRAFT_23072 [Piptocephalis tieghemiana]|nr:MAG: hypothetical protein DHS80DRAFT_23072 [Piptocephalis tieghemiana]